MDQQVAVGATENERTKEQSLVTVALPGSRGGASAQPHHRAAGVCGGEAKGAN